MQKWFLWIVLLIGGSLSACQVPPAALPPSELQTLTAAPNLVTKVVTPTETRFVLPTLLPTITRIPKTSLPQQPTITPAVSPTSTLDIEVELPPAGTQAILTATIKEQSNCRFGPGVAYLFTHPMYAGDTAVVYGRNWNASWLWIKPSNFDRYCWASTVVMELNGSPLSVQLTGTRLPRSSLAVAPVSVSASREGDQVVVSWNEVKMTRGAFRGYLVEVSVCQQNVLNRIAVATYETRYSFKESGTCEMPSGGQIYTAEELGYSDPVLIPWP